MEESQNSHRTGAIVANILMIAALFMPTFSIMGKQTVSFWELTTMSLKSNEGSEGSFLFGFFLMIAIPVGNLLVLVANKKNKLDFGAYAPIGALLFFLYILNHQLSSSFFSLDKLIEYKVGFYIYLFSAIALIIIRLLWPTEKEPQHSAETNIGSTNIEPQHSVETSVESTNIEPRHSAETSVESTNIEPQHSVETNIGSTNTNSVLSIITTRKRFAIFSSMTSNSMCLMVQTYDIKKTIDWVIRIGGILLSLYLIYVCFYVPFLHGWQGELSHWQVLHYFMSSGNEMLQTDKSDMVFTIIIGLIMIVAPIYSIISMGVFYKRKIHRVVSTIIPLFAVFAFTYILTDGFDHKLGEGNGESIRKYFTAAFFLLLLGTGVAYSLLRLFAYIHNKCMSVVERIEHKLFLNTMESNALIARKAITTWFIACAALIILTILFGSSLYETTMFESLAQFLIIPVASIAIFAYSTKLGKSSLLTKVLYCLFVYMIGFLCVWLLTLILVIIWSIISIPVIFLY
ncbi:MAG: hypothetical protein IJ190_13700 [Prevotella sp.]|nr:hypothetical protein [Prevotella sp.]